MHWSGSCQTLWGEPRLDERDSQSQRGVTYRMRNGQQVGLMILLHNTIRYQFQTGFLVNIGTSRCKQLCGRASGS
eukprot:3889151-Rhodomonas_salina.2